MSVNLLALIVSVFSALLIPGFVFMIRLTVKWTRVEAKLDQVVKELGEIVADKDKVHLEIMTVIREDRRATDRRLRWLEEFLWKSEKGRA